MKVANLLDLFSTMAQVCLLLNLLLLVWQYKPVPKQIKRLGPFILIALITEIYATYLTRQAIPNLFLLHIYTLLEFLAWSFFYQHLFKEKVLIQKVLPWLVGIITVLIISNTVFLEPMSGFNSNAKSLVQILLISSAILYFFTAFGKVDLIQALPRSLMLINFAVILYYSGSLFIFMFSRFLNDNKVAQFHQHGLWTINALIYVIFLILILFAIWTAAFRKTKSS